MHLSDILQFPGCRIDSIHNSTDALVIRLSTIAKEAPCKACGTLSSHVHSYYVRHPSDLPILDKRVRLEVRSRRFRCRNCNCAKVTFAEELPSFLPAYARQTSRLARALVQSGLELGGQAAARLLPHLRMATSRDTVLRMLRRYLSKNRLNPSAIIGVDDWAVRKRCSYGLIVVDLLKSRVIDLLPDRTPDTISEWLQRHPRVSVIARDRSRELREGITAGAPHAIQVADRFHLLQNLTDTLYKIVQSRHGDIKKLVKSGAGNLTESEPARADHLSTTLIAEPSAAALRRQARIEQAKTRHADGWTIKAIAEQMGCHPKTISRYLRLDDEGWVEQRRKRRTLLSPHKPYLMKRWAAGVRKGTVLFKEIQERGYEGGITRLRDFLRQLKHQTANGSRADNDTPSQLPRLISARQLAFSMGRPPECLPNSTVQLVRLLETDLYLSETIALAREFTQLVSERKADQFPGWLARAKAAQAPPMRRFALSLEGDLAAVTAALQYEWSNGPTEGHVNRLKMLKRQMYGRAKLDLLRIRMLGT